MPRPLPLALLLIVSTACATTPPAEAAAPIATDGGCQKLEGSNYLEYRVGTTIRAPAPAIWAILTDAPGYPAWNSTVTNISGTIGADQDIELSAKIAPDRTFPLRVSTFDAPTKMVWEDGGASFKGERTFLLTPQADGSTQVTMAEVLTGWMMPMIEGSLPDFCPAFDAFFSDLKTKAETP